MSVARGAISIHAAREGGDPEGTVNLKTKIISIHAAREGGDANSVTAVGLEDGFQSTPPVKAATLRATITPTALTFQSTPPVKAATRQLRCLCWALRISIHAAREGGDRIHS